MLGKASQGLGTWQIGTWFHGVSWPLKGPEFLDLSSTSYRIVKVHVSFTPEEQLYAMSSKKPSAKKQLLNQETKHEVGAVHIYRFWMIMNIYNMMVHSTYECNIFHLGWSRLSIWRLKLVDFFNQGRNWYPGIPDMTSLGKTQKPIPTA